MRVQIQQMRQVAQKGITRVAEGGADGGDKSW
jgi:hypothetical protein